MFDIGLEATTLNLKPDTPNSGASDCLTVRAWGQGSRVSLTPQGAQCLDGSFHKQALHDRLEIHLMNTDANFLLMSQQSLPLLSSRTTMHEGKIAPPSVPCTSLISVFCRIGDPKLCKISSTHGSPSTICETSSSPPYSVLPPCMLTSCGLSIEPQTGLP